MKNMLLLMAMTYLLSCGNQSAESKPTDSDQTKNNDTGAVITDSSKTIQRDSTDTTHLQNLRK